MAEHRFTPGETGGIAAIARHGEGRMVAVTRPGHRNDPLEVTFQPPINGEHTLYVLGDGTLCRLVEGFALAEAKRQRLTIHRRNLIEFTLPRPASGGPADFDLAVELSSLADGQIDGLADLTGAAGRQRMREILDELDRKDP